MQERITELEGKNLLSEDDIIISDTISGDNISISAGKTANFYNQSIAKEGYTAISASYSIEQASSSGQYDSYIYPYRFYLDYDNQCLYFSVRSTASSSTAKVKWVAKIIYIKNR